MLIEFLVVFMPLVLLFVGVWQACEIYAAELVLARASSAAGRAASVVLPDNPEFYSGAPQDSFEGARKADVELAAGMVLAASPHFTKQFEVQIDEVPQRDFGQFTVTVVGRLDCRGLRMLCPWSDTLELRASSTHAYQGAAYEMDPLSSAVSGRLSTAALSRSDCTDGAGGSLSSNGGAASHAGSSSEANGGSSSGSSAGSNSRGGAGSNSRGSGGSSSGSYGGSMQSGGRSSEGGGGATGGGANDGSCSLAPPPRELSAHASLVRAVFARAAADPSSSCSRGLGGAGSGGNESTGGSGGTGARGGADGRDCSDERHAELAHSLAEYCEPLMLLTCQEPRGKKPLSQYCEMRTESATSAKQCVDRAAPLMQSCYRQSRAPASEQELLEKGKRMVSLCASAFTEYCSLTERQICDIAGLNADGVLGQKLIPGTNGKVAIIGRSMGDFKRRGEWGVTDYARQLRAKGYETELFAGPMIKPEWQDEIKALQKQYGVDILPEDVIRHTEFYRQNLLWAQKLVDQGYTVIDIGNPNVKSNFGPFYSGELDTVFNARTASQTVDLRTHHCAAKRTHASARDSN